jgi:hypothetical protein
MDVDIPVTRDILVKYVISAGQAAWEWSGAGGPGNLNVGFIFAGDKIDIVRLVEQNPQVPSEPSAGAKTEIKRKELDWRSSW